MRAPQERTMRDLYDRTRHKDLAVPEEEPAEGRGSGRAEGSGRRDLVARMEDKTVRKRLVSNDNIRVKAESGTCNVCCAPCSSCLHRNHTHADSNIDCGSSQACSTRSEVKKSSLTHSDKGVRNRGDNEEELSAASSNASYSETGGNKALSRSSIAEDSSEVDMPAKRRKLSNEDTKLSRVEYLDDSNSCVTGMPADGKLLLEKKKLLASASSRDLTVKDCKVNTITSHGRLRKQHADESTEKNRSDDMHPRSSVATKKLLRTQSSVSVPKALSPNRQAHELGESQENSSHQRREKASFSNNIMEKTLGGTSKHSGSAGDNNDMLTDCSGSTRNEKRAGLLSKDLESDTSFSKDRIQQHAIFQTNDNARRNEVDKQDLDQDSSMDISDDGELNIQKDVMTDCGNSEGLIDVNVCDICGDVGREYLLATCTRCLEGAEHIYCMRVKLDKVPDDKWLCEECQLKDDCSKTSSKYGVHTENVSEGKKHCSENQNNSKALQAIVPNLDTTRIKCNTPTVDQCHVKNKKNHLVSADTQPHQVKVTNPVAERLEVKNKKLLSLANRKKLQVVTTDLEARPHTSGPTPSSSNKKNQSSEFLLNRKKLRVSTDMESPVSSEGLQSPTISCKRLSGNPSSPNPKHFKADSLKKCDVFSRQNSFKKSNEGSLSSFDNAPVRNAQAVKSSQLSRSHSMGSMVNAKSPVSSPRGILSKQLSFNSSNNGPKVKQLTEGVASKLRPVKHSPKDTRDQGPIKKIMKSGSFKSEGFIRKDACASKQKQSFHLSQDEKPVTPKSVKEKNMLERRASLSFTKPNIPLSPRPVSFMKSGERKLDQNISRPGPSVLKSSKKPGNTNKDSYDIIDKRETSVNQRPTRFISGKDIYGVNIPDPSVISECVKRDSLNDGEEDIPVLGKDGNGMRTEPPGVLPTTSNAMSPESELRNVVPKVSAPEELNDKAVGLEQKPLAGTPNGSCKILEAAQASDDTLPETESLHVLQIIHNGYPGDYKLDKPNLKQEVFLDQSSPENPSRHLVIPEQSYIWQGSFEVSRHGMPEMFDGIQAYLSRSASFKVREVGQQLPHKIQLLEVPRLAIWPPHFKEVNPTENNIALFFFAKDAESYERAYGKLLEDLLLGDLSLIANIGGIELLIFPSDKLPERTQRWNGSLFFWGVFYSRKACSLPELPVLRTNNCPLELIETPTQHDVCSPKVVQPLVIDLNECPNDDLSDPSVPLEPEMEKISAPVDRNIWFESKHEDRKLNACVIHNEETADSKQFVSGHPFAYGSHFSKISTEGRDMAKDYPSAAKDTKRIAGNSNMDEEGFCQNGTLFCVAPQAGAVKSILGEKVVNTQGFQPSAEVSPHFIGSKISDETKSLISKSGIGSLDSRPGSERQKTSHGKNSVCSFEELSSKCSSKIHPLPDGHQCPFDDAKYVYRGPSDLGSLKKPITEHVIHVLSSDDEESPEPTRLSNKASLKADEGSSPLLSLSLSTVATKHNLADSNIGEDEPLSLSLGLPGVVDGSQVLEMKQFLPEKPGINT